MAEKVSKIELIKKNGLKFSTVIEYCCKCTFHKQLDSPQFVSQCHFMSK